jgi:hypothetical protein
MRWWIEDRINTCNICLTLPLSVSPPIGSKNKIKYLPYGVPGSTHKELTLFHISTNDLEALPSSIAQCPSLKMIYANSNKIVQIPLDLAKMQSLEHCNLGNNAIIQLDDEFLERFGTPNAKDGKCTKVVSSFWGIFLDCPSFVDLLTHLFAMWYDFAGCKGQYAAGAKSSIEGRQVSTRCFCDGSLLTVFY